MSKKMTCRMILLQLVRLFTRWSSSERGNMMTYFWGDMAYLITFVNSVFYLTNLREAINTNILKHRTLSHGGGSGAWWSLS